VEKPMELLPPPTQATRYFAAAFNLQDLLPGLLVP
jgi:hypothetical protein